MNSMLAWPRVFCALLVAIILFGILKLHRDLKVVMDVLGSIHGLITDVAVHLEDSDLLVDKIKANGDDDLGESPA